MTTNAAYGLAVFFDLRPSSEDRIDVLARTIQPRHARSPARTPYEIHRASGLIWRAARPS